MPHEAPRTYPHSALTQSILAEAIRVQEALGPGLLDTNWRSIGIELYLAQGGQDEEAHSDS